MTLAAFSSAFVDFSLTLQSQRQFAIKLADIGGASESQRQQFRKAMLEGIETIVREAIPALAPAKSRAVAGIMLNVFKSIGLISQESQATQRGLLAETKDMLRVYLCSVAGTAE